MIEKQLLQAVEPLIEDIVSLEKRIDAIELTPGPAGVDGKDGADGVGIAAIKQFEGEARALIELTDGQSVEIELPVAEKGDQGEPGPAGADGKDADPFEIVNLIKNDAEILAKVKGEPGPAGPVGAGVDVKPWEPGIYVPGEMVQHYMGRIYTAKSRTNEEPGDSADWERVGLYGMRFTGGFKADRAYEAGDIFIKDFSAFMWDGTKSHLIAARQKQTPAVEVAKHMLQMPALLDSVCKGLVDPLAAIVEERLEVMVSEKMASPIFADDSGQLYYVTGDDAQPLIPKELFRYIDASAGPDEKPPLIRFIGEWVYGDAHERGDVARYGNQLYVCFKSGKGDTIDSNFVQMLNSTVIGIDGGGGSGGAALPASNLPGLALLATSPTASHHWVDAIGLINVVANPAAMNLLPAEARVNGSLVMVQSAGAGLGPSLYRYENGQFREIIPPMPTDNTLRGLFYNPQTRRIEWFDARALPATVNTEADLSNRAILPTGHLVSGKLVYVRANGTLYEFTATQASVTNTVADWSPLVTKVQHYARIGNLPDPATASPPLQDGQMAYVDFDVAAAVYGRLFLYDLPNNRWNPVNLKSWIKDNRNNPDQATDQARGDFMTTTENLHKELKVYDGTAWQKIYSEDDVKAWIAAGSQFRGTAENDGYGTIGSLAFSRLPAQSTLNINNKGWYWTFVGQTGHVIAANEIGGAASGIDGARLSVGDWIQVAEITPPVYNTPGDATSGVATPGVYQYVHIPGDLLSKSRGDGLYGLNNWVNGAYEAGSLVVHNGDVWKATAAVVLADGEPAAVTAPARPQISRITIPGNLLTGDRVEVTIGVDTYDATVQAGESLAAFVTRMIAEIPLSAQLRAHVTAAAVAGQPNAFDLTGLNNTSLPAITVTANATHVIIQSASSGRNNWAKVNISGGVKSVSSDADLPATGVANGSVYLVLSSARAGGKQALYSWDQGAGVWQELGGGGNPLLLNGGAIIYPKSFAWDGAATKPTPSISGDLLVNTTKKQMEAFSSDGAAWTDFIPAGGVQLWSGTGNRPTPNSPGSLLVNTTTKQPVAYVSNNAWVDFLNPPRLQNPQWQRMANAQEFAAAKNTINGTFSRKQFSNMVGGGTYELKAIFEAECTIDNTAVSFYLRWAGSNTNLATTSYTSTWAASRRRVEMSTVFSITANQTSIDFELSIFSPSYNNDRRWTMNKDNLGYYLLTHLA